MLEIKFRKNLLKNGLRFIEVPLKNTGATSVLFLVKAGSRFEKKDKWGIAHFLEHMFFKGGKKYKTKDEIASAIDSMGGFFNATTDKEVVSFFVKLPGKKIDKALDIFQDMFLYPSFKEIDIEQEKKVITEEINMYDDSPMFQIEEVLESLLYKNNPLSRRIIGEKETVKKIKREDLINYKNSYYFSQNIVLIVAGDTSSISSKKISKIFNFSSGKVIRYIKKPKESQNKPEFIFKFKETEQTHLSLGIRFPEAVYNNKDFFKAKILSIILGEGMSSRLFISLRENKGLAYKINSFIQSFIDTGYLGISAGVDNNRVIEAIRTIISECNKIKAGKISKKELIKAKEYFKGKLILKLDDSLDTAFYLGNQELLTGKILPISKVFEEIDKIKIEDILRLSWKNFRNNKLNLALIGPFKDNEKIKKFLSF